MLSRLDKLRASFSGLKALAPASVSGSRSTAAGRAAASPAAPAPPPADPVKEKLAGEGLALTGTLLLHSLHFVVSAAGTVILLYSLLASGYWMLSPVVEAVPRRRARALLLGGVRAAQREIGFYLVALGCINAVVGLLTALAVW